MRNNSEIDDELTVYKEEIIGFIDKIDNLEWIQFLHRLIKNLIK